MKLLAECRVGAAGEHLERDREGRPDRVADLRGSRRAQPHPAERGVDALDRTGRGVGQGEIEVEDERPQRYGMSAFRGRIPIVRIPSSSITRCMVPSE